MVLEENEFDSYIHEEVPVLEGDEAKALHKNNMVMEKRIVADSIKDHLIPHVSSLKTPKSMFDAITKLFEGKNINQKMTLRNQLKNVKILLRPGNSQAATVRDSPQSAFPTSPLTVWYRESVWFTVRLP